MKILLIDDDLEMVKTLQGCLSKYFTVEISCSGIEGETLVYMNDYDVVVLDVMLKGCNGIEMCRKIRKNNFNVPILILSGKLELEDKVTALNSGADDYLTKPFVLEELIARIRSLSRRNSRNILSNVLYVGDLKIDSDARSVKRMGNDIKLTKTDFNLLEYLVKNIGRVITRDMILDHVWASNNESLTNVVDVHIKYIRDQVDKPFEKKLIKTVHGLGYKIEA